MPRELLDISAFPMLGVCSEHGCRKVVFGAGTCVEHDSVPARAPMPAKQVSRIHAALALEDEVADTVPAR